MMKFENLKMQNKLLMMFFITGILPIFVIAIYVLYKGEGNIKEEVKKSNILYANLSKDSLNRYFNERKVNGEVLANTKRLHEGLIYYNQNGDGRDWEMHYKSIDDALLYALKMYGYTDIFSTDIKGNVVYSATLKKELENVNLDDREYIKTSMKGVQNWSDLFYSEYVMDEILVLSTPVYETNNHKLIGTINMMINQDKLDEMISQGLEILGASADIYVINETGLLLSDAKQGEYKDGILKKSIQTKAYEQLKGPIVDKDLNFIDMYEYKNYMGNLVYGSLTTVMFGDAIEGLVIEVGKDEVLKHAEELRIDVYISLVAIAILGTLIAIFISRVIVIAFNKLINNLNTIANLDMTVEIDDKYLKRKDEIGKISNTMRDMTKNMREMVIKVSNSSERLAAASEELTATSDQAVTSAQEISKTVEDIAKGATSQAENTAEGSEKLNKLGSLMDEDQKYMMNLNDASLKINKVVNEGLEVVDNLTKKTKTSESAIKSVYDKIIKTNKSSENIGETSKVINTIAEQTN
ncbi:MAG TPA: hypothetical protein DEG71_02755, partial [Clostridiales bacterium]|nr:hypothetical protein [Clostridiales bacterium]